MDNDLLLALGNLVDSEGFGEVIEALAECAGERDEFGIQRELDELGVVVHEHACTGAEFGDAPPLTSIRAESISFVPGVDILLED